ncbi:uncharacterized protein LOC134214132 [Armigeres subalbatus]|uniref:uncharacterized protein LOC134214132 n=1 Tax=Armigeres subalbatus TaxID=124917 RepID=UPI002ED1BEAA
MSFVKGTIALVLLVVAISKVESIRTENGNQIVTLGTFAAADVTCLTKRIYRFQPDPQTITFISTTNINWIRVSRINQHAKSGISAPITGGALGTPQVTLTIEDTANKNYFLNDVLVVMRCAA